LIKSHAEIRSFDHLRCPQKAKDAYAVRRQLQILSLTTSSTLKAISQFHEACARLQQDCNNSNQRMRLHSPEQKLPSATHHLDSPTIHSIAQLTISIHNNTSAQRVTHRTLRQHMHSAIVPCKIQTLWLQKTSYEFGKFCIS
jgi:hypothetical protein